MKEILFSPPIAFLVYVFLVALLNRFGKLLAGKANPTPYKVSTYSSGEAPPSTLAAPGYRPFFVVALFFAILHIGALILGSSALSPISAIYLVGLMVALLALILG